MPHLTFRCAFCNSQTQKPSSAVNRARRLGVNLYCDRTCSGFGRRKGKTEAQKVAEKSEYDRQYRAANKTMLKQKKREYYEQTFDPVKMAAKRKVRMPKHLEYCRRPEYRVKKQAYDQTYRAEKVYGPFAEAFLTSMALRREVKDRASDYDIRTDNNTLNKTLKRKRDVSA